MAKNTGVLLPRQKRERESVFCVSWLEAVACVTDAHTSVAEWIEKTPYLASPGRPSCVYQPWEEPI